ncbi:hypothetical protein CI102_14694 [Trichoderma harzianum]|nr:hypothetical protein CI102_14694 [Trichoderma harzianum]
MCSIPRRGLRSIFDADARLHVIVSDVIYNHDGSPSRQRQEQYSRRYRAVVFAHESDKEQKCNGETGCRFDQTGRVVLPGCALAGGNSLHSGESSSISVLSRCGRFNSRANYSSISRRFSSHETLWRFRRDCVQTRKFMEAIRKITAHIWQTCGLPINCEAQRRTSNWRSWKKKLAQLRFQ